jgi:nucleoside-diphosphate-sugar epimerase
MKLSDKIIFEDIKEATEGMDLTPLKGAKILLLGASGLIGTYFSYFFYYLNTEFQFGIEADLYTKHAVEPGSRLAFLLENKGLHFFTHDASQPIIYEKQYDFMIHGAGYSSPAFFLEDPIKTIDLNYIGMKSMLESAIKYSPEAKILFLSSSEVYGSPTSEYFPTPETYAGNSSIANNRACYIESKRLAEVLCLGYIKMYNLWVRIARPALFYGPGLTMQDGKVIGQFMNKAYREKVITMLDDGVDLRCFCYAGDTLRELLEILLHAKDVIYNVGSDQEEVSIFDLATIIGEILHAPVIRGPGKNAIVGGAPSRVHLDMHKLNNEFNFKPRVSMKEGLKRTIDWNLAELQ